ncbi:uncharacterized protein TRIVIDRAFT_185525 [Trichoderma virens Gv29-8]|uniref:Uncharacterized protein n=1 Tax=Hypocrea virens (strain Gv29-8 / FGSC 10586) TaxID=413071 RepID=G9MGS0_HYPVG|nr:uncharacterized protein TRIVIDRAFT_185525 [Trichoderma virens Gv29-8]EHK25915.1 hypothetical protein TRIVIDRAFT_185525 [Trichoderma virens Gv29-8]
MPKRGSNSGHLRRGSSSSRGITQMIPHQADMPQQQQQHLPSLSNMLAIWQGRLDGPVIETVGLAHAFTTTHHRPSAFQGEHALPLVSVPALHHESSSSGSSVPTVASGRAGRRLSEGSLPIHVLLSAQNQMPHRRDEDPLYTAS